MAEPAPRPDSGRARQGSGERPTRRCPKCDAQYPLDFLVCPIDATTLQIEGIAGADGFVGEVLAGSFCVTALLGSGGMGRVYEAEHVRLPKRFAVKVLHEHFASHPEAMARFEREAQAVARVDNEHVVDVVDVVRAKDGRPCMVTELLRGEELGDVLERSGKLPLPTAITVCRQVCRGLAAAHAVGIIHRDLKPSNLFLLQREAGTVHVKILDFGVAKVTDGADITRTGSVVGTPAYMAPEQARGSANVDARADIYAVGAVLYRMLTGVSPFPDDDPARTLARLLTEDPRRPRSIDKTIPEGVEALIQRAMARAPQDRPASAQELDRLLAAFDRPAPAALARVVLPTAASPSDAPAIASMATVPAATPPPARVAAEDATRTARRARPAAIALALGVSLAAGAALLTTVALAIRIVRRDVDPAEDASLIAAASAAFVALLALIWVVRVLVGRWRSAPAMQRLGEGLRASLLSLFVSLGVLGLGFRGYAAIALPLPSTWGSALDLGVVQIPTLLAIDLGVVLVPTLLALVVLAVGLQRAGRVA